MNADWLDHSASVYLGPLLPTRGECRQARNDLADLIALYGPVEVARAARKGLDTRNQAAE